MLTWQCKNFFAANAHRNTKLKSDCFVVILNRSNQIQTCEFYWVMNENETSIKRHVLRIKIITAIIANVFSLQNLICRKRCSRNIEKRGWHTVNKHRCNYNLGIKKFSDHWLEGKKPLAHTCLMATSRATLYEMEVNSSFWML